MNGAAKLHSEVPKLDSFLSFPEERDLAQWLDRELPSMGHHVLGAEIKIGEGRADILTRNGSRFDLGWDDWERTTGTGAEKILAKLSEKHEALWIWELKNKPGGARDVAQVSKYVPLEIQFRLVLVSAEFDRDTERIARAHPLLGLMRPVITSAGIKPEWLVEAQQAKCLSIHYQQLDAMARESRQ